MLQRDADDRGPCLSLELGWRAFRNDAATAEHHNAIRQLIGLLEILGGEEDSDALAPQGTHRIPHRLTAARIQASGWFIKEEHPGPSDQGGGDVRPPTHTSGEGSHTPVEELFQAKFPGYNRGSGASLGSVKACEPTKEHEVLSHRLRLIKRSVLPGQRDSGPHPRGVRSEITARDGHRACIRIRMHEGRQHRDGGGFTAAVRPQQAEHCAGGPSRSMPSTATTSPKDLRRPRTMISGWVFRWVRAGPSLTVAIIPLVETDTAASKQQGITYFRKPYLNAREGVGKGSLDKSQFDEEPALHTLAALRPSGHLQRPAVRCCYDLLPWPEPAAPDPDLLPLTRAKALHWLGNSNPSPLLGTWHVPGFTRRDPSGHNLHGRGRLSR